MQPYNRFTGEGTGFSFANFNAYELADTVRRALVLYHNEHDAYLRVQRQAMAQDFSFTRSAEEYAHLYLLLLPEDTAPKHDAGDEAFRRPARRAGDRYDRAPRLHGHGVVRFRCRR